jgi:hypothetical protein
MYFEGNSASGEAAQNSCRSALRSLIEGSSSRLRLKQPYSAPTVAHGAIGTLSELSPNFVDGLRDQAALA